MSKRAPGLFDLLLHYQPPPVPMGEAPDVAHLPSDMLQTHGHDYMRRYFLLGSPRQPGATARYHHILTSDEDRHLHDHPWDFISVILSGSYVETTPTSETEYGPGSVLPRRAEAQHRLTLTHPVWTFVITSPARRPWGFHTEDGWTHWRTYLGHDVTPLPL